MRHHLLLRFPCLICKDSLLHSSGGCKSELKVSARLLSPEASPCGLHMAVFPSCLYIIILFVSLSYSHVYVVRRVMLVWVCAPMHAGICVHAFTCMWQPEENVRFFLNYSPPHFLRCVFVV